MFNGITTDICAKAWDLVHAGFQRGVDAGLINAYTGGIAVLNPADPEGEPLFTAGVGDEQGKFIGYATSKCRLAWRERMDTSAILKDHPHLYREGDLHWPGGIYRHGLVVAYSGVQGEYDDMISEWMVAAIRAISQLDFKAAEAKK